MWIKGGQSGVENARSVKRFRSTSMITHGEVEIRTKSCQPVGFGLCSVVVAAAPDAALRVSPCLTRSFDTMDDGARASRGRHQGSGEASPSAT